MRVIVAVVIAVVLIGGSAIADPANQTGSGAAKSDFEIRRGEAVDVRPPATSGASIPYPYTAATEPPREPYRRPVPCSPYARGTDGTTTCIGIDDRGPPGKQRVVAKSPHRAPPPPMQIARRETRPEPRMMTVPQRELTDTRFYPPPREFVLQQPGGGGLLEFLGMVLSQ